MSGPCACDPGVNTIAQAVVWLAYRQKQYDVAIRYLKMCDPADDDPGLLHHLSMHLLENDDLAGAIVLLERAVAARGDAKDDVGSILLRLELGRLYHFTENDKKSAEHFAHVLPALENPDQFDFGKAEKAALLSEAAATYDLIGESFLLADRPKEAIAAFEKGNAKHHNPGLLNYNLAGVSAAREKLPKPWSCWKTPSRFAGQRKELAPLNCWPKS